MLPGCTISIVNTQASAHLEAIKHSLRNSKLIDTSGVTLEQTTTGKFTIVLLDTSTQVVGPIKRLNALQATYALVQSGAELDSLCVQFVSEQGEEVATTAYGPTNVRNVSDLYARDKDTRRLVEYIIFNVDTRSAGFLDGAIEAMNEHADWFSYDKGGFDYLFEYFTMCLAGDYTYCPGMIAMYNMFVGTDEVILANLFEYFLTDCDCPNTNYSEG
ncbi:hypothetical protein LEM8419_00673 [Neolewinella maritima]|uniref:Uncharacterized protein n=2 Tax=Neolewinella maritima TaxID=1383882 RepID=A0ABM9AXW7_9BACT|nr:hypothetical protein LEM8419_00673 [Neolewinella maritima]